MHRRCRSSIKLIVADFFFLLSIDGCASRRSWHLACNCVWNEYAKPQSESGSDKSESRSDRSDTESESDAGADSKPGADTAPQPDTESECSGSGNDPAVGLLDDDLHVRRAPAALIAATTVA